MTSVTVGVVGIIGFVGLVAPHIARKLVGSDLRASLPLSAVLGSLLLLLADAIAQRGNQGGGYPVGIVTSLLGAPLLLVLLKKALNGHNGRVMKENPRKNGRIEKAVCDRRKPLERTHYKELTAGALDELERHGAKNTVVVHVSGTWEIPAVAQKAFDLEEET